MAFCVRNLSVLAYANGFTLWHYKAAGDALSSLGRRDYFDDAVDMLSGGDMLMVSAADGGQVMCIAAQDDRLVAMPMS